ncbi:hypothetical protein [Noviluteimonas gilva]|uniref:DUF1376 domain-containing protein n=1 Tax=Noviluteimonas gilva TaxID=2682097 RepID=A0A7C9HR20_9GAMM|nr:hypothetical protein [Lysobacter gilvus]MUV13553.1 hypothetical protein [Lysobacter gilvus]
MPSRIIREGITTSEPLSFVSFEAETLFYRLIVTADDFGLYDGRPVIVRARCMPLRDVTASQVGEWLRELAEHSLILQYEDEGRPYIAIPKFKQRTRNAAPKYPLPDGWNTNDGQLTGNGQSLASVVGGVVGGVFEDESNGAAPPAAQPPAITLPLNTGAEFPVTPEQVREFTDLYPAVDVLAQLRKMRGWLIANPANRKTKAGILRFVTRWLGQEQDKSGKSGAGTPPTSHPASGKPKGPSESPLEAQLNWIAHMVRSGGMTDEEALAAREKAVAKHRGST